MDYKAFVYRWTDVLTGKYYIGAHKGTPDDGYICSSKEMLREYNSRPQHFKREILEFFLDWESSHTFEIKILSEVNAAANTCYYNRHNGTHKFYCIGHSETSRSRLKGKQSPSYGRVVSDEERQKRSSRLKGICPSPKCIEAARLHATGKIASPETRVKMSLTRKGKPKSENHRKLLSEAAKARYINNWSTVICFHCGESFKRKTSEVKSNKQFCSKRCYYNHGIGL